MTTVLWIIVGVIVLAVLAGAVAAGKPIRSLLSSAVQGFCALAAVNMAGAFSGVTLGLTTFTAGVCGVLGLPGVITLLILQVILR